MNVKILDTSGSTVEAEIKTGGRMALPSMQDGWRFNFERHSKAKDAKTYVLAALMSPETIEGCLIFKMKDKTEPYMAYLEIAPHNKGKEKKYDRVAGCLIAYACWLSFQYGENDYCGWLAFDVIEPDDESQVRLMALYSEKYGAKRFGETTMLVSPLDGEKLIGKYLGI